MRILIVGPPRHRAAVRAELEGAGVEVAGEFLTLAAARSARLGADGILIAPSGDERTFDAGDVDVEPLTTREQDVLHLLAEGLPNKIIAERLGISDQTVKFHVASITGKLGASNRTEAVHLAARRGLISI